MATGEDDAKHREAAMKGTIRFANGKRAWPELGPWAALVLAVGLAVAVATDGRLPGTGAKALFALLFVLDGVMIRWLTRPRAA